MSTAAEPSAIARAIIDANLYLVLGTADASGQPWVSPVYYACADYAEFYWVSSPEARHSRNLAERPRLSLVIFDSHAPINTGQAVYLSAVAETLTGVGLDRGLDVFSRSSLARGGRAWTADDVGASARLRLYRALASEHWILDPDPDRLGDVRIRVTP
jgi:nitroimidazol reductase NimA-like FMN-containing flavoprotein (pyridoxamine 5'-phosphate oxidase superfamily)